MKFSFGFSLMMAGVLAVSAFADAKPAAQTCTLGQGRPVCCKAYVADHCGPVTCCEVGNALFHSGSRCQTCIDHADTVALAAKSCASASACAPAQAGKSGAAKANCADCAECPDEAGLRAFLSPTALAEQVGE